MGCFVVIMVMGNIIGFFWNRWRWGEEIVSFYLYSDRRIFRSFCSLGGYVIELRLIEEVVSVRCYF